MPSLTHSSKKNSCGVWIMMPAPSPVLFSQPQAPRCSMFSRMVSASETIWWDLLLLMFATKPMPHASRSNSGLYKPLLAILRLVELDFIQLLYIILEFILRRIAGNRIKLHKKCEIFETFARIIFHFICTFSALHQVPEQIVVFVQFGVIHLVFF